MRYGYARVSTNEQKTDPQQAALKAAKCDHIFTDHGKTGTNMKRSAWQECMKAMRPGDTLVVWSFDRIARTLRDLLKAIGDLEERGVHFESITQKFDTTSYVGKALVQLIGIFAEFEHGMMMERAAAGRADAKRRKVKFGPKFKISPERLALAREDIEKGYSLSFIAEKRLEVDRTTLWRALNDPDYGRGNSAK